MKIQSVPNGFMYTDGQTVPLTLSFGRSVLPQTLSVAIFDSAGASWGEVTNKIPLEKIIQNEYETSLLIPERLPPGKYIFHVRIFENEKEISFKEIILFKTSGEFIIDQFYSIPQTSRAGKNVIIKALLKSPEDTDPFLRWILRDKILREGFLSEGYDTISWLAEREEGFYPILLEVFPEYSDPSFESSVFATTEIIVSRKHIIEMNSLAPEEAYSLIYHFAGDQNPVNESEFVNASYGILKPDVLDDVIGYTFSAENGLSARGAILPASSGKIGAFSINGRVASANEQSPGNLIAFTDGDEEIFSLSIDNAGHLAFAIGEYVSQSLFSIPEIRDFTLSFIPQAKGVEVRWFYNGLYGGLDTLDAILPEIPLRQKAIIGSSENLTGADVFIDELGVYVGELDDSKIDSEQFSRVLAYDLGEHLVASDGFDGMELPEEGLGSNENLSLEEGNLVIPRGNAILLEIFPQPVNDLEIVLSFPYGYSPPEQGSVQADGQNKERGDTWRVYLRDKNDVELFTMDNDGLVIEEDTNTGRKSAKLRFSLLKSKKSVNKGLNNVKPRGFLSLFFETDVENSGKTLLDYYIISTNVDSRISGKI